VVVEVKEDGETESSSTWSVNARSPSLRFRSPVSLSSRSPRPPRWSAKDASLSLSSIH